MYQGGNNVALEYPGDTGPAQSGVEISLGQLIGKNKPTDCQVVDHDSARKHACRLHDPLLIGANKTGCDGRFFF